MGAQDTHLMTNDCTIKLISEINMDLKFQIDSINRMRDSMVTRNQRRCSKHPANHDMSEQHRLPIKAENTKRDMVESNLPREDDVPRDQGSDQKRIKIETSQSPTPRRDRRAQDTTSHTSAYTMSQGPQGVKKNFIRRRASLTEYMKQLMDIEAMNERHMKGSMEGC